ncbi:toprim domain-containing protein [Escherichia coli]|nr:toprim domain-containing protein [Escherichia coli]
MDKIECLRRDVVKGMASPYLKSKGLECFATKPLVLRCGRTFIPMQDARGVVVAFQTISADGGEKRFGGEAKGAFRIINQQTQPVRIIIAEGLATTLSAHQLQHDAMAVMAGSAGNLEAVARTMREHHPEAEIIIAADNDNTGKGKNTGKVAAEKAALAVGGTVALAPAEDGEGRDWNDVLVSEGREKATMLFAGNMYRPTAAEKTTSRKQRRATSDGESGVVIEDTDEGPMMRLRLRDASLDICQKVDVVGYGSYEGKECRVLRWMNNGRPATVAVNLGGFASSAALTTLMDGGLLVRDGRQLRSALANWIIEQKPATRWTLAASAGWTDDDRAYLLPDGQVIGDETPALFMGKSDVAGG